MALGKIAPVEGLYLVRQSHDTRNFLPVWYQWLTSEKWQPSYLWFRDRVASVITEIDGVALPFARETVDLALARYLQKLVGMEKMQGQVAFLRRIVKRCLPESGMVILRRILSRITFRQLTLDSLLSPNCPFHNDFIPVYHSITNYKGQVK